MTYLLNQNSSKKIAKFKTETYGEDREVFVNTSKYLAKQKR